MEEDFEFEPVPRVEDPEVRLYIHRAEQDPEDDTLFDEYDLFNL